MDLRGVGDRWLRGEAIEGVRFAHNEPVSVLAGPHAGALGIVVLLVALQPEPSFTVALGDGRTVRLRQSSLRAAV